MISLHAAYSLQVLENASDISAVNRSLLRELQNIDSLNDHFKDKESFQGCRVQDIVTDQERDNTVIVRFATYNRAEVDSLVDVIANGRLGQELGSYINATVFGVRHIGFTIEANPSEIEQWRNVFATR